MGDKKPYPYGRFHRFSKPRRIPPPKIDRQRCQSKLPDGRMCNGRMVYARRDGAKLNPPREYCRECFRYTDGKLAIRTRAYLAWVAAQKQKKEAEA